jgi:hypothetical protein
MGILHRVVASLVITFLAAAAWVFARPREPAVVPLRPLLSKVSRWLCRSSLHCRRSTVDTPRSRCPILTTQPKTAEAHGGPLALENRTDARGYRAVLRLLA